MLDVENALFMNTRRRHKSAEAREMLPLTSIFHCQIIIQNFDLFLLSQIVSPLSPILGIRSIDEFDRTHSSPWRNCRILTCLPSCALFVKIWRFNCFCSTRDFEVLLDFEIENLFIIFKIFQLVSTRSIENN